MGGGRSGQSRDPTDERSSSAESINRSTRAASNRASATLRTAFVDDSRHRSDRLPKRSLILGLALPDGHHAPSHRGELLPHRPIARHVARQLGLPVSGIASGTASQLAAFVLVPKAAMDQDGELCRREDDVRRARKGSHMESVAQALAVQRPPYTQLGRDATQTAPR